MQTGWGAGWGDNKNIETMHLQLFTHSNRKHFSFSFSMKVINVILNNTIRVVVNEISVFQSVQYQ